MTNNKYYIWYTAIIRNAKLENRKKGATHYEVHHIIPTALGGTNIKDNLVLLTGKEHCTCHHLLTKFTFGKDQSKMNYAWWGMVNAWGREKNKVRVTNRVYEALKAAIAKQISESNTGKSYPCSEETKKKLAESKHGPNNPMYGKPAKHRGTKRPGIGGIKKGTKWTKEAHANIMALRSTAEYKNKMQTTVYKNENRNKKISDAQIGRLGTSLGKVWYNDGINEFYADTIPANATPGRLSGLNKNKKGMCWFNNGLVNKQFHLGTEPEGYLRGRISKK